jgi:hypothetical protein
VAKVLAAIGGLVTGVFVALATYRAMAPPAPPSADIECPAFGDDKSPRGKLCWRLNQIEESIGAVQANEQARRSREAREKTMLGHTPTVSAEKLH